MKLGRIVGKVWATQKDSQLVGVKLYVMQPIDEKYQPVGKPIIAADAIGSGEGDIVFWVGSREATFIFPDKKIPCDAGIVGIVDSAYNEPRESIERRKKQLIADHFIER